MGLKELVGMGSFWFFGNRKLKCTGKVQYPGFLAEVIYIEYREWRQGIIVPSLSVHGIDDE